MSIYQYAINIDNISKKQLDILASFVSKERQEKAMKYKLFVDQARCIIGEVMIRYILMKKYQLNRKKAIFGITEYGKPYLKNREDVYFNISHSGSWVVCAIGEQPVGVDIEKISKVDLDIAKRFFTTHEYNRIVLCSTEDKQSEFFKLWTLKESYIKMIGKGLSIPLNSFELQSGKNREYLFTCGKRDDDFQFLCKRIDDMHYYALCSNSNKIHTLEIMDIYEIETYLSNN
ncbi:4'-phosphopantetheinyl transferase family protein [Anaerocolumna jejuensis]|uniref:4'-phosphopantetheinyl transferase family protein n=1 Tax=Anaerocolumna jejuensis TaxID=259063 RepID=UPI003F7BD45E